MGFKKAGLDFATRLGVGSQAAKLYFERFDEEFDSIDDDIRTYSSNDTEGTVLLPAIQGNFRRDYFVLAHAFRTRGYSPLVIICDAALPACMAKASHGDLDDRTTCSHCNGRGEAYLDAFGLESLSLSDLTDGEGMPGQAIHNVSYRGVEISEYAASSTRRFLRKYQLDLDDDPDRTVYIRFLQAARALTDAAHNVFEKRQIDACASYWASYVYGGIFLAVASEYDITAVSVARGINGPSLLIGDQRNAVPTPWFTNDTAVEAILREPLTKEESTELEREMESRIHKSGTTIPQVNDSDEGYDTTYETTVGLFTNLVWDEAVEAGSPIFDDYFAWVRATLEILGGKDDTLLVLKAHPAEEFAGTNQRVGDWLRDSYESLPENVEFLSPDTDVSPYRLLEELDVTVTYNSLIGLESAYLGVPVLVGGRAFYRGYGFTADPSTEEEYRDTLEDVKSLTLTDDRQTRAKRFAHMFLFRKHFDFPFYPSRERDHVRVTHESIISNDSLNRLVELITAGETVLNPRTSTTE